MSLLAKWNTLTCNHACIMCNYWGIEVRHLLHQQVKNITLNPLIQQQQPFGKPLYPESELVFIPSEEDVRKAQKLFVPTKTHVIRYCKGVYQPSDVPSHNKPEIAFLGRSNVGKSSLIRELLIAAPKVHVRTSKTPGHTKLVNFFEVGDAFMLVDMPGYGHRQPVNFELTAEGYLKRNKKEVLSSMATNFTILRLPSISHLALCSHPTQQLLMTFLLVDSKVGIQPADHIAIDMFFQFGLPFTFVLTKADKAGKRALYSTLVSLKEIMTTTASSACFPQPFLVRWDGGSCSADMHGHQSMDHFDSSVKSTGIPLLKTFIAHIAGSLEAR